ncbi:hypothetical protein B0H11DRAFT_2246892 [Mycena galericulata]|nr:hypothetical protein B0H11DRAFT_2246892 [Mycena galericulata]
MLVRLPLLVVVVPPHTDPTSTPTSPAPRPRPCQHRYRLQGPPPSGRPLRGARAGAVRDVAPPKRPPYTGETRARYGKEDESLKREGRKTPATPHLHLASRAFSAEDRGMMMGELL